MSFCLSPSCVTAQGSEQIYSVIIYTHLLLCEKQDNEILSLFSNEIHCNKYNYIEKIIF